MRGVAPDDAYWGHDASELLAALTTSLQGLSSIDMFVYGADNKPTWFVVGAKAQPGAPAGHAIFTGDLYTVTGPYYGSPINSAPAVGRKVGALTFDATGISTARLTYTVDGTLVVKDVTRQFWGYENFSGSYSGGWVFDLTSCVPASDNDHIPKPGTWDRSSQP